ncbi:RHS repeat-associated core domain-containing protein [Frankia sp. Cas4]|uniref:RHS repeat protein n=1 Tax=Frankia sp. Cas4 TaxID=3073927 RepID=UPI002AD3216C|nr:RHS repeat-associated core domain-containing protein [Frankia sp. Cas4]
MSDSTSGTTTYGYDGLDRLAVRNSTTLGYAGVEKEPVADGTSTYARDPDGDLIGLGTPGGAWAPLADPHGDVVAAFTTNGAGLTDQKVFDPFGVPTTAGSANVRVGFQGSWTDPTTAKVSAEARWYTPGTGGFVSRDSVGLPLTSGISANRYVYGNANPLASNDPSGHFSPGDFFREGVRDLKVGARGVGAVATVVEEAAVPVVEVAGEVVAGAAVVASVPGWVPIVGAVVVGGALGVAAGYVYDRYGNSQARTSPATTDVPLDYSWFPGLVPAEFSPATQNDRAIDVKPTVKPRFTSGGRVVQVHPRTQLKPIPLPKPRIPPMPLPQLKQHAPAGPVWSGRRILRRRMVGRRRGSRWSLRSVRRGFVRIRCRRGMGRLGRVRTVAARWWGVRRRWRLPARRTSPGLIRPRVARAAHPVAVSLPPRRPSPTHPPTPTTMAETTTRLFIGHRRWSGGVLN